jgi:hypothetical protein
MALTATTAARCQASGRESAGRARFSTASRTRRAKFVKTGFDRGLVQFHPFKLGAMMGYRSIIF